MAIRPIVYVPIEPLHLPSPAIVGQCLKNVMSHRLHPNHNVASSIYPHTL